MKRVPVSKVWFAKIDNEDFELVNSFKWYIQKAKISNTTYARIDYVIKGVITVTFMHRLILGLTDTKILVDHIDHNGLNNQKNNLRIVNHSQNMANRRSRENSSSKYLGVSIFRRHYKNNNYTYWQALIQKDKKLIRLGLFKNEVDAAIAYNKKAIELHGEFANLNKIEQS